MNNLTTIRKQIREMDASELMHYAGVLTAQMYHENTAELDIQMAEIENQFRQITGSEFPVNELLKQNTPVSC